MPGATFSEQNILWLALALGPAPLTPAAILDPEAALAAHWSLRQQAFFWRQACSLAQLKRQAREQLTQLHRLGGCAIFRWQETYPRRLLDLPRPPRVLFLRGELLPCRWVALVGSRAASYQGTELTRALASGLARAGVGVVSGGALGIDAAAHEGALQAGGATVAVLGSGLDRLYPERNSKLLQQVARSGALLTPFALGQRPLRHHFIQRNGLIAALAEVVVVVEAQQRSGALNTASWARDLGRPLGTACRGPGASGLRAQGAARVASEEDILNILHGRSAPAEGLKLDADQACAWPQLQHAALSVDELAQLCGWPAGRAASTLLRLELEGLVRALPGGRFAAIS